MPPTKQITIKSILESFDKQYSTGGEWWKEGMEITPSMIKSFYRQQITNLLDDMPVDEMKLPKPDNNGMIEAQFVFKDSGYNEHCKELVEWRKKILK